MCQYCTHCINYIKQRTEGERDRGKRERALRVHLCSICNNFNNRQDPAVWILTPDVLLGTANWAKRAVENYFGTH